MRILTSIAICACLQTATPAAASSPCQARQNAYRPVAASQCVLATRDAPQPAGVNAAVAKS